MRKPLAWMLGLVLWIALAHAAVAGRTGGSMGGGSWGGGGGGGRSYSGGGYSGGHSYSSNNYNYSGGGYYGGGGGGGSVGGLEIVFIIIVVVIAIGAQAMKARQNMTYDDTPGFGGGSYDDGSYFDRSNYADVTVLRIALDGRARKFVQNELARIAKTADTSTPEGRVTMLREVALLLRRLKDAWVYGGAVNEVMREQSKQKAVFDRYVDDARARFMNETIRNEQGQTTTAAAPEASRELRESEGLILVSIVVAAHSELFEVRRIGDGEDLRQALDSASHRSAQDLIAIEIIWMPSDNDDLVSSMELESKYPPPDLVKIQGALVGKVFCAYCGGPFPRELVSCPHCGAPAADAKAAT